MGLDPAQFLSGARQVQGATTGMHSAVTGLSGKIMSLTNLFTLAGQAMQLMRAASGPLILAADMEKTEVGMNTIIKKMEVTRGLINQLRTLAANTPLELPELTASARTLLGAGWKLGDLVKDLTMLGDVAAGAQTDLQGLAFLMQQVVGMHRLLTQDMNQFSQRGVAGLKEALAEVRNTDTSQLAKDMEQGEVSVQDLMKALRRMTSEGGTYFKAMENQSKTTYGLLSTLKDSVNQVWLAFSQPLNDALKPYLTSAIALTDKLAGKARTFVGTFQMLFKDSGKGLHEAVDWIFNPRLWKNIGTYIEFALASAAHKFSEALISAWRTFNATLPFGLHSDDAPLKAGEQMEKDAAGIYAHGMDLLGKVIAKDVLQGVGRTMSVVNDAWHSAIVKQSGEQGKQTAAFDQAIQGPSLFQQFMAGFKEAVDFLKRTKTDLAADADSKQSHSSRGGGNDDDGHGRADGRHRIRGYHQGDVRKDIRAKNILRPDLRHNGLDYFDRLPSSPLDAYKFGHHGPSPLDYFKRNPRLTGEQIHMARATHQQPGSHSWDKELRQLNATMQKVAKNTEGLKVQ